MGAAPGAGVDPSALAAKNFYGPDDPFAFEDGSVRSPPQMAARTPSKAEAGQPPDLPSLLYNERIVYIGMPLVQQVTELLIAELMYFNQVRPEDEVTLYINSFGSQQQKQAIAFESEALAVLDTMDYIAAQQIDLLTEYTGQPRETIEEEFSRDRYYSPESAVEFGLIDEVMKMDTGKTVVSAFWENALFKYTKDDEKRDARLKKYEEPGREEVERANRGMEEFGLVEDRVERGPPRSSP